MTSLIGIKCRDGVVIGADSSATFGDGKYVRTIEQLTTKKIEIIGNTNRMIIAGTGAVGHHQRFVEAVSRENAKKGFDGKSELDVARGLAATGVNDFATTTPPPHMREVPYSALVAYRAAGHICLAEIIGAAGFQPEVKKADDLWFTSAGSGQGITDPFLALFRSIFWQDGCPDVKGGIFTAYWALAHACETNPGGINYPIKIAVYGMKAGRLDAWLLDENELAETKDLVESATDHFRGFRQILLGQTAAQAPPKA